MDKIINGESRVFKPILRWPGGKSRMLKHLLPLLPDHQCYCEPFAGGLALLMRKNPSHIEVVNDLNGDLIALYRCVQYHNDELLREIGHLIAGRQTMHDLLRNPGLTDIQRAARFYCRNRKSFGGGGRTLGIVRSKGSGCAFIRSKNVDLLSQARDRLSNVVVENLPYERCLELYDAPETCFFMDPPYLNARPTAYAGWTESDITRFRSHVVKLKARWIITLDDSEFVRSTFYDCKLTPVTTKCGTVNKRLQPGATFGELIITPA